MISNSEFVIIFIKTMYIKKIITGRFGFCDILNNKVQQASAFTLAGITFLDLDYPNITKTSWESSTVYGRMFYETTFYLCCFNVGFYSSTLPDATFSLFNLSVSDIIDKDMEKYQRK